MRRIWLRDVGFLLSVVAAIQVAQAADARAGASGFNASCSFCHQPAGQGIAGQFPRLAGRVDTIATTPSGRRYLANVVLYGMSGQIQVDGTSIVGLMPPFATTLSDDALAAILNYVLRFQKKGKVAPFSATEIKLQRHTPALTPADVFALRGELEPSEAIQH